MIILIGTHMYTHTHTYMYAFVYVCLFVHHSMTFVRACFCCSFSARPTVYNRPGKHNTRLTLCMDGRSKGRQGSTDTRKENRK